MGRNRGGRRRAARRPGGRTPLAVAVVAVLSVTATLLHTELRSRTAEAADTKSVGERPSTVVAVAPGAGTGHVFDRVLAPARTVVRDSSGDVLATFTDGSRTAVLRGPVRTFTEPRTTSASVSTDSWVRLMDQAWKEGAETSTWFGTWFAAALGDTTPDVLAVSFEYGDGAPAKKDKAGVQYAGDAGFGPLNPDGSSGNDLRLEVTDFYDYLGMEWTFPDRRRVRPDRERHAMFDCSGFVRMVYGYRMGHPLARNDVEGAALPRTANGMATVGPGVQVVNRSGPEQPAHLDLLLPGDLLFFDIDARTNERMDHTGIYLGLDDSGHPRFISSREEANGPTIGDLGGTSRIDGGGFYATGLRSAKRL